MLLASNQHIKSTSPTFDCQLSNMQLESNHHVEQANIMMAKGRNIIDDQATSHYFIWCCCFKSWSPKLLLVQSVFFSFRIFTLYILVLREMLQFWHIFSPETQIQPPTTVTTPLLDARRTWEKWHLWMLRARWEERKSLRFLREIIRRLVDRCFTKNCWEKWYSIYICNIFDIFIRNCIISRTDGAYPIQRTPTCKQDHATHCILGVLPW